MQPVLSIYKPDRDMQDWVDRATYMGITLEKRVLSEIGLNLHIMQVSGSAADHTVDFSVMFHLPHMKNGIQMRLPTVYTNDLIIDEAYNAILICVSGAIADEYDAVKQTGYRAAEDSDAYQYFVETRCAMHTWWIPREPPYIQVDQIKE